MLSYNAILCWGFLVMAYDWVQSHILAYEAENSSQLNPTWLCSTACIFQLPPLYIYVVYSSVHLPSAHPPAKLGKTPIRASTLVFDLSLISLSSLISYLLSLTYLLSYQFTRAWPGSWVWRCRCTGTSRGPSPALWILFASEPTRKIQITKFVITLCLFAGDRNCPHFVLYVTLYIYGVLMILLSLLRYLSLHTLKSPYTDYFANEKCVVFLKLILLILEKYTEEIPHCSVIVQPIF